MEFWGHQYRHLRILTLSMITILGVTGCATVSIPTYIRDKYPYKKQFYAAFEDTLQAVQDTLRSDGWQLSPPMDPGIYEQSSIQPRGKEALLTTEIRQSSFFIGSSYVRLNVFLRPGSDTQTEVEFRYTKITSLPIKTFSSYRKDALIRRYWKTIEERLK